MRKRKGEREIEKGGRVRDRQTDKQTETDRQTDRRRQIQRNTHTVSE